MTRNFVRYICKDIRGQNEPDKILPVRQRRVRFPRHGVEATPGPAHGFAGVAHPRPREERAAWRVSRRCQRKLALAAGAR